MKKIPKATRDNLDDLALKIASTGDTINAVVKKINDLIANELTAAIAAHNEARADLTSALEEIAQDIDSYISDRSEKWQEGDTGQAYSAWKNSVESAGSDIFEVIAPDPIFVDDVYDDAETILENLEDEPSI